MQDQQDRDFRAQKIYEFKLNVKKYIQYLNDQSPIVGDSHLVLIDLCERYGKENVKREVKKQLAEISQ